MTAIAAGDYHSLALKGDGTVVAWGCANGADEGQCSVPSGLSRVTAIAAGEYHSLARVEYNQRYVGPSQKAYGADSASRLGLRVLRYRKLRSAVRRCI